MIAYSQAEENVMTNRMSIARGREERDLPYLNLLLAELRSKRKLVYIFTAAVFLLACVYYFVYPNQYTATARMIPSTPNAAEGGAALMNSVFEGTGLAGLVANRISSESELYVKLLGSRPVLDSVLTLDYARRGMTGSGSLRNEFGAGNSTLARRRLLNLTDVSLDKKTGIVTVSVTTEYPTLSRDICNEYVSRLDEFKQHIDRNSAGEVSLFLAERIDDQQKVLDSSEVRQRKFYSANRNYLYSDDPALKLEVERLQQDVLLQRQLLMTLKQLKASSDMEREKRLPRLSVLEWGELPTIKSGPLRIRSIAAVTIGGLIFVAGLLALKVSYRLYFSQTTRTELEDSCRIVGRDIRHMVNRIKEPISGSVDGTYTS
jgi:uncharacterized protein involved in exopolysaccharide biosynthesis